jgi:hypothetical protein
MRGGPVRRWLEVQVRTFDGHTQLSTGFEHLKQAKTVTVSTKCCVMNAQWKIAHWTIMLMKTLIRDKFSKISNFRRVLNVVCFLLGNSPASGYFRAKPFPVLYPNISQT